MEPELELSVQSLYYLQISWVYQDKVSGNYDPSCVTHILFKLWHISNICTNIIYRSQCQTHTHKHTIQQILDQNETICTTHFNKSHLWNGIKLATEERWQLYIYKEILHFLGIHKLDVARKWLPLKGDYSSGVHSACIILSNAK